MATARRTGTSESVSTYGAGQTYTVLATWESATDNDNVTGTVSPVLACLAAQYNDHVTMQDATNNATYFRIIRPQAANFHTGIRDTGVRFYYTGANFMLGLENYNQIQDLVIKVTASSGFGETIESYGVFAAIGCIFTNCQNSGAGALSGFYISSGTSTLVDCLFENNENAGFYGDNTGTIVAYNCTSVSNGGTQIVRTGGTFTVTNCLASGGSACFSGTMTQSYNASSDTTASGTGSRIGKIFTFVNAGAFDYHLLASDAGAKGFGTDLSADGTFAFDDDIDRTTISGTWNIGMDWFAAASDTLFAQSAF